MQVKLVTAAALATLATAMPTAETQNVEVRDTKIGDAYLDSRHTADLVVSGGCVLIPVYGGNRVKFNKGTRCRFYRHGTSGCQPHDHIGGAPGLVWQGPEGFRTRRRGSGLILAGLGRFWTHNGSA
ncbi:hypothetical protein BU23DRAFT_106120 [Bimuria novae-zelandiae CBS 107.79]|uniref:Uncharacterized protein n=1 Tax=Bimuria novae-zelandiae CBS 107.79 TaxID=1447943 RepID=A0A6A5VT79_9PLEO|nr:hypothetical protein BU23DRAFT_106120 [Bimuria novae-zelandiae CBS 107.79]